MVAFSPRIWDLPTWFLQCTCEARWWEIGIKRIIHVFTVRKWRNCRVSWHFPDSIQTCPAQNSVVMLYLQCYSSAALRSCPETGRDRGGSNHWVGLALQAILHIYSIVWCFAFYPCNMLVTYKHSVFLLAEYEEQWRWFHASECLCTQWNPRRGNKFGEYGKSGAESDV